MVWLVNAFAVGCLAASVIVMWRGHATMLARLHLLLGQARHVDPSRFEKQLARHDPFGGVWMSSRKLVRLATAVDVTDFGPECVRIQREARNAYNRILLGFSPMIAFGLAMALLTGLGIMTP